MLYRCNCNNFSIKKNNFRKNIKNLIYKYFNENINIINKHGIAFLFIEPGGFKDEYLILSFLKNLYNKNYNHKIQIILIEEMKNSFFIELYNKINYYLQRKYKKFNIEIFVYYSNNILKTIDRIKENIKTLFLICIDPFHNTYLPNENNEEFLNEYFQNEIKQKFNSIFQFYLYADNKNNKKLIIK